MISKVKQGSCLGSCLTLSSPNTHNNRPSHHWPCVKSCLVGGREKYTSKQSGAYALLSRKRWAVTHFVRPHFMLTGPEAFSEQPGPSKLRACAWTHQKRHCATPVQLVWRARNTDNLQLVWPYREDIPNCYITPVSVYLFRYCNIFVLTEFSCLCVFILTPKRHNINIHDFFRFFFFFFFF